MPRPDRKPAHQGQLGHGQHNHGQHSHGQHSHGLPDTEAIAEQVFVALADPSRRAILAALASGGPATATDLAGRLPITRQAIAKHLALLTEAGLVTAEPGERRRVRYQLRSAPMQVAKQFLAALARDWDGPLGALKDHLNRQDDRQ
jgi:DNA-binding transcriptional ArsR family regulator